jgi:hypothetical protein
MKINAIILIICAWLGGLKVKAQFIHPMIFEVNAPASIQGSYNYGPQSGAGWGINALTSGPVSGQLVWGYDITPDSLVCDTVTNNYAGKIVMLRRGTCNYSLKMLNVQNAGAIGCVVCNNQGGTAVVNMAAGAFGAQVTIPSVHISEQDCAILAARLAAGDTVVATFRKPSISNAVGFYQYETPQSQIRTLSGIKVDVTNVTGSPVNNIISSVKITNPSGISTTLLDTIASLLPDITINSIFSGTYTPSAMGIYSMVFKSSLSNDSIIRTFKIGGNQFAQDEQTNYTWLGLTDANFAAGNYRFDLGNFYYSGANSATVKKVSFSLFDGNLYFGKVFDLRLYEIPANLSTATDYSNFSLLAVGADTIDASDTADYTLITKPLFDVNTLADSVQLLPDRQYLIVVSHTGNGSILQSPRFAFSGNQPTLSNGTFVYSDQFYLGGFSTNPRPVIRLEIDEPNNSWTGAVSTDWNTAGNWATGVVPAVSDNAIISNVTPNFFPLISAPVTINNLTINMGASVDVAPGAGLTLDGTLTNNGTFTLQSDATGTAWLDDFSLGGTVVGNISVQRYNPIGLDGFRQLGTPVAMPNMSGVSGFTVSGTPGQIIPHPTCNPNFTASNSPYGTWMELAENNPVLVPGCSQSLFNVLTSGGMTSGRGYYMDVTAGSTLTFTGAPNTGTVSNNTPTWVNGTVSGGWNMVANPFPSPLRWELADVPAGFDAIGQIWVTSGTYTGTWQPLDPSAGGTQAVAIGQAFQLKVSAPNTTPAFTLGNANRTTLAPTYLFSGSDPMTLNIDITGNGFADLTKVRFIEGATDTYDGMYDSPKVLGNAAQPMVYSVWNGQNLSINTFNTLADVYTVPLGVKTGTAGNYDFTFSNTDQFPASAFIYLEDTQNGTMQDLRQNGTYAFSIGTGATDNRFLLHFYPPVKAEAADADCENGASVTLTEQAPASWNYTVSDAQNQTVATGQLEGSSVVNDLSAGTYTLTLTETTSGYVAQETFTVNGPAQVTAQAFASVTVAEAGQEIQFTASAQNADTYLWSFGDGNTSEDMNPIHLYNAPGIYAVMLTASNADCAETDGLNIQVNGSSADLDDAFAQNGVSLWNDGNTVFIRFEQAWEGKTVFTLYDVQGKRILNRQFNDAQGTVTVDCGVLAAGTYTAELRGNGKTLSRKTVMGVK